MMLDVHKDGARASTYLPPMVGERERELAPEPNQVAKNLAILMRWRGWNQTALAKRSGVSQRHISDLLRGHSDCTTEMVEQLASAFTMPPWQLMIENLEEELLTSTDLQILVNTYRAHPAGRKLILGAVDMVRAPPKG